MNCHRKASERTLRRDGRWRALLRLDEAIERNTGSDCYADKIRLLRQVYFTDVDESERNEPLNLPP